MQCCCCCCRCCCCCSSLTISHVPDYREKVLWYLTHADSSPTHSLTHSLVATAPQDGYTLERVDVYGLVDGAHETVVISSAECYVARSDNPSFSVSTRLFLFLDLDSRRTQVGPEPLGTLADVTWHAVGPSGPNKVTYDQWDGAGPISNDDGNAGRTTSITSLLPCARSHPKHMTPISSL